MIKPETTEAGTPRLLSHANYDKLRLTNHNGRTVVYSMTGHYKHSDAYVSASRYLSNRFPRFTPVCDVHFEIYESGDRWSWRPIAASKIVVGTRLPYKLFTRGFRGLPRSMPKHTSGFRFAAEAARSASGYFAQVEYGRPGVNGVDFLAKNFGNDGWGWILLRLPALLTTPNPFFEGGALGLVPPAVAAEPPRVDGGTDEKDAELRVTLLRVFDPVERLYAAGHSDELVASILGVPESAVEAARRALCVAETPAPAEVVNDVEVAGKLVDLAEELEHEAFEFSVTVEALYERAKELLASIRGVQ